MTNISPDITPATCIEGSSLAQPPCSSGDPEMASAKDKETTNNGYLGCQYPTSLLPEVRVISADDRPNTCKFRIRDVSPMAEPKHKFGSTCYRILVPETVTERIILFVCLIILFTLLASLTYLVVKIDCIYCTNTTKEKPKAASLLSAMDQSADPCEDFYQYACGTWDKRHLIPEDKSSINTFEVLADRLQIILKGLLEESVNRFDSSATIKAKLFYKSCMDITQIRRVGDRPIRELLKSLGGWPVVEKNWQPPDYGIEVLLGRLKKDFNEGIMIEQWVGPDDKNSSINILQLDQMQLGLPSKDYFLKDSSAEALQAYHKYMTEVAVLLGANKSTAPLELLKIIEFEIELANVTSAETDQPTPGTTYWKLSLNELQNQVPDINWLLYFRNVLNFNIEGDELVVSYAMTYFTQLGLLMKKTDRRIIHNYVIWRLVQSTVLPHMIDEYQYKRLDFKKILLGILSERSRWRDCVDWTNKQLGMAVGALFIRDNFSLESKVTAMDMIQSIREAFNELLNENEWMDDETRVVAREKAEAMKERIGYPDLLTDPHELDNQYIMLNVTEDQFIVNVFNVLQFDALQNLEKLRLPVDKDKWSTEPAIVNAFYNPNKNHIVIPAGILQPLFYSQHFPKSLNYGGIGVVIGHEITHGFDDKGRQFDKNGNLLEWWDSDTIETFREKAQCMVDQYSKYKMQEVNIHVNGRMTQGENIADNGGLKQSFRAYKKWVAKHGEEPLLPGIAMTHDQLFFLNYAQIWCGSMRPEDALTKVRSSVHSPGPTRVWGPLSNSVDFAEAFGCPLGSRMNPVDKCVVW
ncbi:neprilysin-1-like isoform X2 [Adelges cooleyi]|uniref:neprilysin-1-like isoform X2 n=1 Tax=Adelges cooleyi TaxID=133065 RepID=UPI00217F5327|nr:neprilysin-1-like isoform X2 [Adelges cooleyi]